MRGADAAWRPPRAPAKFEQPPLVAAPCSAARRPPVESEARVRDGERSAPFSSDNGPCARAGPTCRPELVVHGGLLDPQLVKIARVFTTRAEAEKMLLRSSNRGGACVSHGDNSIFPYRSGRSFLFYIVYIPYFIFSIFHQDQSFIFCDTHGYRIFVSSRKNS